MRKTEKTSGKREVVRVSLDLSEPFFRRLTELERVTHADSKAGVIRQALQVFEYIAFKTLEGYEFRSVDKNGVERELAFFSPFTRMREPEPEHTPEEALVG